MTLESIMAVQRLSRCRGQRRRSRKSLSCSALQGSRKKKRKKKKGQKKTPIRLDTGRMLKKITEKDEMGIILWWDEENKEELQE